MSFREHLVAPDVAETEEIMNNEDRKQDENEANEVPMDTDDNLDEQCNQQHMNKTNVNTEEENETTPITGNFELGDSASKDPEKEVSDFTTNEKEVSDSVNKEKGVSDSVPKEKEVSDSVPKEKEVNDSVPKEEEVFEEPMNLDGMDNGNVRNDDIIIMTVHWIVFSYKESRNNNPIYGCMLPNLSPNLQSVYNNNVAS